MATEAIAFGILFVCNDIVTTELFEHTFGVLRCERFEVTVDETLMIEIKWHCKINSKFEEDWLSQDSHSRYRSTWSNFITARMHNGIVQSGSAKVVLNNEPLIETLWSFVKPINNTCTKKMKILLQNLGVAEDKASPFIREFGTQFELAGAYEEYFSYKTTIGPGEDNMVVCRDTYDEIELHSDENWDLRVHW